MENLIENRVANLNWTEINTELSDHGFALTAPLLSPEECADLVALYPADDNFRSKVVMERFRFGKGDYKYFRYPLPNTVQRLRTSTYSHLAKIANQWRAALGDNAPAFPPTHPEFLDRCHRAKQSLSTPLMLHYEAGGFNCLHQDLYGEIAFPLQLVILLGQPGQDWTGGEFVLVENIPRAQSRAQVIAANRGQGIIFTTRYRPAKGARGYYRVAVRHGVSTVRSGVRHTLGITYHDAK
jgi:hypothetical protein